MRTTALTGLPARFLDKLGMTKKKDATAHSQVMLSLS